MLRNEIEIEREEGRAVVALDPSAPSLAAALGQAGHPLNTRCGGRGWCGGCEIEIMSGRLAPRQPGGGGMAQRGAVRACRLSSAQPARARVRIPARSLLSAPPAVAESFVIDLPVRDDPLFKPSPGKDTVCAIDLGTTTVAVLLADLSPGCPALGTKGGLNAQVSFGDNVLTRIAAASERGALEAMREAAVAGSIAPLIGQACAACGRDVSRIAGAVVAGNTTMLHILAGEDPASLGAAPFTPKFLGARRLGAEETGLARALPGFDAELALLPGFSAYVGADLAAGVLSTGMIFDEQPSLLVDLGTNGEIVLQKDGEFLAAATAAGPAFEGSGLSNGQRAQPGAVAAVRIGLDPFFLEASTAGGLPLGSAAGVCGSGYVDFLAEGRRSGLLDRRGRFVPEAWEALPLRARGEIDGIRAFRLAPGAAVTEADISLLLQAKAAIGAGIETLLERAGLAAEQIGRICLAGGFGLRLNTENAVAAGLLPGVETRRIRVVGNAALGGAWLALRDRGVWREIEMIRGRCQAVELNSDPDFEDRYIEHLSLGP